jgi:hypothetical protein
MIMVPLVLASVCLVGVTFAGVLIVRRIVARRSAGASLRDVTVSRAWLTQHVGEDRP